MAMYIKKFPQRFNKLNKKSEAKGCLVKNATDCHLTIFHPIQMITK